MKFSDDSIGSVPSSWRRVSIPLCFPTDIISNKFYSSLQQVQLSIDEQRKEANNSEIDYDLPRSVLSDKIDDELDDLNIQSLLETINTVARKLETATANRIRMKNHISRCISSVRRLPFEILGEIFINCLAPYLLSHDVTYPDPMRPLISLAHVSSTWRAVAFGTPRLWNVLSISSEIPTRSAVNLAAIWFMNAREVPLSVSLDLGTFDSEPLREEIFISNSNRIIKLQLLATVLKNVPHILRLSDGHFENLETLIVNFPSTTPCVDNDTISAFRSAPRLRRVLIKSRMNINPRTWIDASASRTGGFVFPWAQLTHLSIETNISFTTWHKLFSECLSLEHCGFNVDFENGPSNMLERLPIVTLPNLIGLSVRVGPDDGFLTLEDFALPALTELELFSAQINFAWIRIYKRILQFRNLRRLYLLVCESTDEDLIILLRYTPNITELCLMLYIYINPDKGFLWEALSISKPEDDHNQDILTRLDFLDIYLWLDADFTQKVSPVKFADMVKSRCPAQLEHDAGPSRHSPLSRLAVHLTTDGFVGTMKALLDPCTSSGLDWVVDTWSISSPFEHHRRDQFW